MRKRSLLIAIVLFAVGGYFVYDYLYQDHRDISAEESIVEISAVELVEKFKRGNGDEYLNKTITVSGTVTERDSNSITLDDGVHCSFDEQLAEESSSTVKIKGRCIGFDELFEIVKLDQSTILK